MAALTAVPTPVRRPAGAVAHVVELAASGDRDAWDELVEEFSGLVWAVARSHRLSDADAADVAQTTWLRLVEHLDRLRDPDRVGAWLATTARHESLRLLRGARRQVPVGDDLPEPAQESRSLDAALLADERDAALWQAVERLLPRDRALLRMLVADPAPSYEEVGVALDMPIGSIGPTRARSLARLRREAELVGLAPDAMHN